MIESDRIRIRKAEDRLIALYTDWPRELRRISSVEEVENIGRIMHALEFAAEAHEGQRRSSGDPYVLHPINVALAVAYDGGDADMVSAAVLHDVLEDTPVSYSQLEKEFGKKVADIVALLSKPKYINRRWVDPKSYEYSQPEDIPEGIKLAVNKRKDDLYYGPKGLGSGLHVDALLIKYYDKMENLTDVQGLTAEEIKRQIEPVLRLWGDVRPILPPEAAMRFFTTIETLSRVAEKRFLRVKRGKKVKARTVVLGADSKPQNFGELFSGNVIKIYRDPKEERIWVHIPFDLRERPENSPEGNPVGFLQEMTQSKREQSIIEQLITLGIRGRIRTARSPLPLGFVRDHAFSISGLSAAYPGWTYNRIVNDLRADLTRFHKYHYSPRRLRASGNRTPRDPGRAQKKGRGFFRRRGK